MEFTVAAVTKFPTAKIHTEIGCHSVHLML